MVVVLGMCPSVPLGFVFVVQLISAAECRLNVTFASCKGSEDEFRGDVGTAPLPGRPGSTVQITMLRAR